MEVEIMLDFNICNFNSNCLKVCTLDWYLVI